MKTRRTRYFLTKLHDNSPDMCLRGEREAPIHRAEYVRQKARLDWKPARLDVGQSIFSQQMPSEGDQVVEMEFVRVFAGMLAEIPRPNVIQRNNHLRFILDPDHTANLPIADRQTKDPPRRQHVVDEIVSIKHFFGESHILNP